MTGRLWSVVAAAVAVAATATVVVPQHAASLAALAAGTVVVVLSVFLLVLAGPLATTEPPRTALDTGPRTGAPTLEPQGLRDARRDLATRGDGTAPPAVRTRLAAAARLRLHAVGIDLDEPGGPERASALLRPDTWTLATTTAGAGRIVDPVRAARTVHHTLDELDALPTGGPRDHHR